MSAPPPPPPSMPPPPAGGVEPMSESDARMWAMLSHLSGIVISIIGPLIIMLIFGPRNAFVKNQSTEALNFQITLLIAVIISLILTLVIIGIFLLIIVGIGGLVLMIMGGIKAYGGEEYRYPINIRMVK